VLERIPSRFQVIRHVRVKLACACCERIVQAAAPSRPIERGIAGPGLLAHVLVSKYGDHLPLYRQSEIYAREGVELDRSTLADWVGETSRLFDPLLEALRRHVMSAQKLHADDTPVPVLAPGLGRTKIGRLWTYVRDDRPAGDQTPPAVWFAYSPDRTGDHPKANSEERCRRMVTRGSISSTKQGAFRKRPAGRMCAGSFTISRWLTSLRSPPKRWNGSGHCMRSKRRSRDAQLKNVAGSATYAVGRCLDR